MPVIRHFNEEFTLAERPTQARSCIPASYDTLLIVTYYLLSLHNTPFLPCHGVILTSISRMIQAQRHGHTRLAEGTFLVRHDSSCRPLDWTLQQLSPPPLPHAGYSPSQQRPASMLNLSSTLVFSNLKQLILNWFLVRDLKITIDAFVGWVITASYCLTRDGIVGNFWIVRTAF